MQNRILAFLAFAAIACFVGAASAQAAGVTPTKGQSAEQQQKDIAECQSLATQSSGFHPTAPPPVASAPPQAGGRLKGAAKGAAASAVATEVRGGEAYDKASDDAQKEYRQEQAQGAAAAGAALGASKQRQDRRASKKEAEQQEAQTASQKSAYDQSYQGCLLGRGYSVTP